MENRVYLAAAFGWNTRWIDQVAIAQLREKDVLATQECAERQWLQSQSHVCKHHWIKIAGYVPIINIVAGLIILNYIKDESSSRSLNPKHECLWSTRAISMIFTGPLMILVDAVMFLFQYQIAQQYAEQHPQEMGQFESGHSHTAAHWPGHPINCVTCTT